MADEGKWQTVRRRKRPQVVSRSTVTGTYESPFVAGGIAGRDRSYRRSLSVGRFSTTRTEFDTGKVSYRTTRTGRRHTHFGEGGEVHTASHVPSSGGSIEGPLRPGTKRTYD